MTDTADKTAAARTARQERKAEVLVDAYMTRNDQKTAERYGITDRTLRRWRLEMGRDAELSDLVHLKRAKAEAEWADELPQALRDGITFLRRAAVEGDPKDPAMVRAVSDTVKMLCESDLSRKFMERRLNGFTASQPGAMGSPGTQARSAHAAAGPEAGRRSTN